jgi:hypothetical protein
METWTGDFSKMLETRRIRVLAPYSRSLFFNDKGRERGLSAELVREYERSLNKKDRRELRNRPLTVFLIPLTRDRLIEDVAKGRGHRETSRKRRPVSPSSTSWRRRIEAPGSRSYRRRFLKVSSVDDLAGRTVHVGASSSYHEH